MIMRSRFLRTALHPIARGAEQSYNCAALKRIADLNIPNLLLSKELLNEQLTQACELLL